MTVDEANCVQVVVKTPDPPLVREIELKNVGYLQRQPTQVHCVACQRVGLSTVRLEEVTCLQRLAAFTKMCKNWEGRHDINHYCGHCGCYIGRFVELSCTERCLSKRARKMAAQGEMKLKTKPRDCAERMQQARDNVKEKKAKERADNEVRELVAKAKAEAEARAETVK